MYKTTATPVIIQFCALWYPFSWQPSFNFVKKKCKLQFCIFSLSTSLAGLVFWFNLGTWFKLIGLRFIRSCIMSEISCVYYMLSWLWYLIYNNLFWLFAARRVWNCYWWRKWPAIDSWPGTVVHSLGCSLCHTAC